MRSACTLWREATWENYVVTGNIRLEAALDGGVHVFVAANSSLITTLFTFSNLPDNVDFPHADSHVLFSGDLASPDYQDPELH